MNNTLHARTLGQGPDVILLHGLFGQGSNLGSVSRTLASDFRVHCLDLPDHGRSPWLAEASLPAYAQAVRDWMDQHQLPAAHILGHSLGGKVAMELAVTQPERVRKLVVADMAPVTYTEHHQQILEALQEVVGQQCETRAAAEALLSKVIDDPGVVGYLLMSLERGAGHEVYQWRFNLAGLADAYGRLRGRLPGGTARVSAKGAIRLHSGGSRAGDPTALSRESAGDG